MTLFSFSFSAIRRSAFSICSGFSSSLYPLTFPLRIKLKIKKKNQKQFYLFKLFSVSLNLLMHFLSSIWMFLLPHCPFMICGWVFYRNFQLRLEVSILKLYILFISSNERCLRRRSICCSVTVLSRNLHTSSMTPRRFCFIRSKLV